MTNKILCIAAFTLLLGFQACTKNTAKNLMNAEETAVTTQPANTTTVSWDKMEHDFGAIDEGDKVSTQFTFTNTGNEPLVITNAKGSCGCTVPKWPKEPVAPGDTGTIEVEFNSKNKPGQQTKTVTIQANTEENVTRLKINANVAKID